MRARDPREPARTASPLELLTDLCVVVAVGQSALALHHGLTGGHVEQAVLGYLTTFFAIWWAWLNFSWFASAYDNDDSGYRLLTVLQIVGVLVLAAGIEAMSEGEFAVGVAGYVIMRVALVGQWLRAARDDPARRRTCLRYAAGIAVVQVGWVAFAIIAPHRTSFVLALFGLLALAELAVPVVAERAGMTRWHPHHIAERYGLFFIIVLGEAILSSTLAIKQAFVDETARAGSVVTLMLGGVLTVFSLWWLYFSREAAEVLSPAQDDGTVTPYLWGFGHYLIFGGTAAVGAGLAARGEYWSHPADVSVLTTALAVTVPVAVLLLAMWAFHLRLHDPSWRTAGLFLGAAALVLGSTFLPYVELATGLVVALLVVGVMRVAGSSS